ncbi:uncharacterized protein LOC107978713 isoform X4 [Cricetulus griseus]|uniref:Uncharacterized protein LOC107978713 isoform X4 n=1 Tax=Cricetulus griseus TaxID=10029 RepID=A0A9J7GQI5_CRIGR|nr:uncharacterized protein LOC107978713 isoform X4 [Cricetulus griseus]XP_035316138.1 uncharacterized protein LOC107978713 isoform X4 [Cricetulus griseus]
MKYCINIFSVSKEDLKAACGISHRSDSQVYSTNQLQLHHRTLSQGRLEEFCVALCGIELTEILSHGIKGISVWSYLTGERSRNLFLLWSPTYEMFSASA